MKNINKQHRKEQYIKSIFENYFSEEYIKEIINFFLINNQYSQISYYGSKHGLSHLFSVYNKAILKPIILQINVKSQEEDQDPNLDEFNDLLSTSSFERISIYEFEHEQYKNRNILHTIKKTGNQYDIQNPLAIYNLYVILNKNNYISDEIIQPLEQCRNLKNLTLQGEYIPFGKQGIINIGEAISKCVHLQKLSLNIKQSHINTKGIVQFTKILTNNYQLTFLDLNLEENNIDCQAIKDISATLILYKKLSFLSFGLNLNLIERQGLMSFGRNLAECKSLTQLKIDFRSNLFYYEDVINFGENLSKNSMLKSILLYFEIPERSQIEQTNTNLEQQSLTNSLSKCSGLKNLTISMRRYKNSTDFIKFAIGLGSISNLISLNLHFFQNLIDSQGILLLSESLSKLLNLQSLLLNLNSCELKVQDVTQLVQALKFCSKLKNLTLDIKGNQIVDSRLEIGKCLSLLERLQTAQIQISEQILSISIRKTAIKAKRLVSIDMIQNFKSYQNQYQNYTYV